MQSSTITDKKITDEYVTELLRKKGIEAPINLVTIIVNVLQKVPNLAEATVVRLANELGITMFGKEIKDTLSPTAGRKIYNVHPYRKAGSGAVCMATYSDAEESYVLLGQKKLRPGQVSTPQILLGGYFQPHPLIGHIPGIEKLTADQKDEIEEAIRSGLQNAYQTMTPQADPKVSVLPTYDANVSACAVRELREETGLQDIAPQFLTEQSTYPATNPDLHSINLSYLFDSGEQLTAPETKPGSDIETLRWIKFSEIEVKEDAYSARGIPIRKDHGVVLERGARVLLEKNIKAQSDGLVTLATLERHISRCAAQKGKTFATVMGVKPATFLGMRAKVFYTKLEKIAAEYLAWANNDSLLTLAAIEKIVIPSKIPSVGEVGMYRSKSTARPANAATSLIPSSSGHTQRKPGQSG